MSANLTNEILKLAATWEKYGKELQTKGAQTYEKLRTGELPQNDALI